MVKKVYCDETNELSLDSSESRLKITIKRWNNNESLQIKLFPLELKELITDLQHQLDIITAKAEASTLNFSKLDLQKQMEEAFGHIYTIDKDGKAVRKYADY